MTDDTAALIARFRADPNATYTDAEIAVLAEAPPGQAWPAKILALQLFKRGRLDEALPVMRRLVDIEPTDENVVNLVVALRNRRNFGAAVDVLEQRRQLIEPVRYHDLSCACLHGLGRTDEAIRHGTKSLALKDGSAPASPEREVRLQRYDVERPTANVISFSVWGNDVRYIQGAINNAIVARYLYPGWVVRFYTDAAFPTEAREALRRNAAQVVVVEDMPAATYGLFWRFLVEDDADVALYLVRDADSVLNIKERAAVATWLASGKAFHVMRDNVVHSELVLAGMWGAHRGNIGDMAGRIRRFVAAMPKRANYVHKDQHFLRNEIWPLMRSNVLQHDSHFDFMTPLRFDPAFDLPRRMHIGQNDWVHYRQTSRRPGAARHANDPIQPAGDATPLPIPLPVAGGGGHNADR